MKTLKEAIILSDVELIELTSASMRSGINYAIDFINGNIEQKKEEELVISFFEKNKDYITFPITEKEVYDIIYETCLEDEYNRFGYRYISLVKCSLQTIYIFTSYPSSLIGKQGKFMDKIIAKIKEKAETENIDIKLIEVDSVQEDY